MAFTALHEGLDLNCLDQPGIEDDLTNQFVRGLAYPLACIHQFASHHERQIKPLYELKTEKDQCEWRSVSVNLLRENNQAVVRAHYTRIQGYSPKGVRFPFLCVFRLLKTTAKVWDTGSERSPSHRSLLKADEFHFADLELIEIIPWDDF